MGRKAEHVAVALLGARRSFAVPRALEQCGVLDSFYTDLWAGSGPLAVLDAVVPQALRGENLKKMLGRKARDLPAAKVRSFTTFGLLRALRSRRAMDPRSRLRAYADWNADFGRRVVADWPEHADGVYAFNAAGLEILEEAKRRGLYAVLDQTAAPWSVEETLLAEERERWPGWEFGGASAEDWAPMAKREEGEWALADTIVCGSEYVAEGLQSLDVPKEKCAVVPYGIEPASIGAAARPLREGPLRILYAGTVQLRKGVQYLMQALEMLEAGHVEARAVGPIRVSRDARARLAAQMELPGFMSRESLTDQYDWADVLVLPSISEGSANVGYEALARGLPVITTKHAGTVVRDGEEGYVVPLRDAEAIAARLRELAGDRAKLGEMSEKARARAGEFTFDRYAERLTAAVTGSK